MYVNKNMTLRQIAEVSRMGVKVIRRKLDERGVTINPKRRKLALRPKIGGRSVYILIAEEKYGRPLEPNEGVHHIDLDPSLYLLRSLVFPLWFIR